MSDVAIVTRLYEAFAAQDLDPILQLVDEKCVVTQDASLPWGGRHVGHEGVGAFVTALGRRAGDGATTA